MKKLLFDDETIFILAEIAQSYEGDKHILLEIIDGLAIAKTNGIMFQVVYADELAVSDYDYFDLFRSLEMSNDNWEEVVKRIKHHNVQVVAEVFGTKSFDLMINLGVDAIKIHASDITNTPFLQYIGSYDIPILLAVGGAENEEIKRAISMLNNNREIILMHGYQKGPTPISDTHFFKIESLKKEYNLPIGYSDHISGYGNSNFKELSEMAMYFPIISLGAGAQLIEKHVMLDRKKQWEDHESALSVREFKSFVNIIRKVQTSLGKKSLECNQTEIEYRKAAVKSIVAKRDIAIDTTITINDINFKRVNQNIDSLDELNYVLGNKSKVNILRDEAISINKLKVKNK